MVALDAMDLSRFIGFVYGSGFEAQPELLLKIGAQLPLIGNSADTVTAVKIPAVFFAALQQLNINHPDVCYLYPEDYSDDYLVKLVGGSGGTHIRSANSHTYLLTDKYYYQLKINGRPVSLLFLADKHDIEVIGFNEQWLSPSADAPFRYGGAVSNVELSTGVQQQLINAAQKLTREFGLLGLNSLDAIVDETVNAVGQDGQVFVLEINPRLSATVDLYSCAEKNLFERHVNVWLTNICLNNDDLNQNEAHQLNLQCKAHAIVYAAEQIAFSVPTLWPDWVIDTPQLSEKMFMIPSGEPVCTVLAYADSADMAKKIAQSRVEIIQNLLQSLNQDPCTNNCVSMPVQSH
ncbi:MAG TPA: ATP-grasp domain-containing protein [Methylotenera sp.]|jgi:predicted ATP-grasp superfamily ATP-dependent carboligase